MVGGCLKNENLKAYIAVVMLQMSFAGMFLFSKVTLDSGTKAAVFVAYRQAMATVFLTPFALYFKRRDPSPPPPLTLAALCKIFMVASCGLTMSCNLTFVGLKHVSATVSTGMTNVVPLAVFITAICLRIETLNIGEWHGRAKLFGVVLGVGGAMAFTFYSGPPLYKTSNSHHLVADRTYTRGEWIKGCFLCIAAEILYSLWVTLQAPLLQKYPGKLRLMALQTGFSFVAAAIYGATVERNLSSWKIHFDISLLSILYNGILVAGAIYWLQSWLIQRRGPVFCAIFSPLALIISALFSAIVFKEILHFGSVLGSVLLVGGLYCFLWGQNREARSKRTKSSNEVQLQTITAQSTPNPSC